MNRPKEKMVWRAVGGSAGGVGGAATGRGLRRPQLGSSGQEEFWQRRIVFHPGRPDVACATADHPADKPRADAAPYRRRGLQQFSHHAGDHAGQRPGQPHRGCSWAESHQRPTHALRGQPGFFPAALELSEGQRRVPAGATGVCPRPGLVRPPRHFRARYWWPPNRQRCRREPI